MADLLLQLYSPSKLLFDSVRALMSVRLAIRLAGKVPFRSLLSAESIRSWLKLPTRLPIVPAQQVAKVLRCLVPCPAYLDNRLRASVALIRLSLTGR